MNAAGCPVTICRVVPAGYQHHRALDEVVETLSDGISALGHPVRVVVDRLDADGVTVVIGAHLLDPDAAEALPATTVVYNFEQVDLQTGWTDPGRLRALRRTTVWDYSVRNLEHIRTLTGNTRLVHVPLGYVPALTRIPVADPQDIDVLFYGSMNARRQRAVEAIAGRGLAVRTAFGVYGAERDRLVARAKVVLNLHYYRARVFEMVRVSYLLANRKAVAAEADARTEIDADLREGIRLATYEDLPEACRQLVADPALRQRYEEAGYACMTRRPAAGVLRAPLAAAVAARR